MSRTLVSPTHPSVSATVRCAIAAFLLLATSTPVAADFDTPWLITVERIAIRPPAESGVRILVVTVTLDAGDPATYSRLLLERDDLRGRIRERLPRWLEELPGWTPGDALPLERLTDHINGALTRLAGCPARLSAILVR